VKAISNFYGANKVIVECVDGSTHVLRKKHAKLWKKDFLNFVASPKCALHYGQRVSHIKVGIFKNGKFSNSVRTYKTKQKKVK